MPRYAEIDGTEIINVFVADKVFISEHKPNAIECPDSFGVGDKYQNGEFERVVIVTPVEDEAETL